MPTIGNEAKIIQPQKAAHSARAIPKEYVEVAQGMETQFIYEMLKEMKKTIPSESPKSSSESYYESLQDFERAKIMADQGLGIKEMILKQIYPQGAYAPNKGEANE
jgi:Rod binding domain-containing protein